MARELMESACGRRHGIVLPPLVVPYGPADVPGLFNVAVPSVVDREASPASGGIARSVKGATSAAVGEALERYAGSLAPLLTRKESELPSDEEAFKYNDFTLFSEDQQARSNFPHTDLLHQETVFTDVYQLTTNKRAWVPAPLVTMDKRFGSIATSSGMAAGSHKAFVMLRATQELIERDALMITWLHEIAGRRIDLAKEYLAPIAERHGEVMAFDATPAYSSHPVAIVMGMVPRRGRPRFSLGAACRATWAEALDKAYIEWAQGITFVGDRLLRDPDVRFGQPDDVRDFDHHALYYSTEPELWPQLPIFRGEVVSPPKDAPTAEADATSQLHELAERLNRMDFRVFYRSMTTIDLQQIGMKAVRMISPDMVPVHHDHRFPNLGGTAPDFARRYPWWSGEGAFPTRFPHPLG